MYRRDVRAHLPPHVVCAAAGIERTTATGSGYSTAENEAESESDNWQDQKVSTHKLKQALMADDEASYDFHSPSLPGGATDRL